MALYNTHRPVELEEIYGNQGIVESLLNAIEEDAIPHTILLHGPSGCGKTTIARILADRVSTPDDIRELNIAHTRGIDMARPLIEMIRYKPLRSKSRVIVLNECHKGTNEFWNALLEVLEEPPSHTYFILCTTEPDKLLKTVRTRCVDYKVERLDTRTMLELLQQVVEGEEVVVSSKVLRKIAQRSEGSPRDALTILEKILSIEDEEDQIVEVKTIEEVEDFDLKAACRIILRNGNWKDVAAMIKEYNGDIESIRHGMLGYFTAVLLNPKSADAHPIAWAGIRMMEKPFYDSGKAGLCASLYELMTQ